MKIMNKFKLALLLTILILAGCEKAEDLETSVNSRWQAITEQDLDKAYSYYSPGYKNIETLEGFKLRIATAQLSMQWKQGVYKEAQCASEDVCEAAVDVVYSFKFPKRSLGSVEDVPTLVKEQWIKTDGKWYHVPKNN